MKKLLVFSIILMNFNGVGMANQSHLPSSEELKKILTPEQYRCTQENGTEKPFQNLYWDHKADGIYVDVVSKEPLFSSLDKYDSGSGWPSFTKVIEGHDVVRLEDRSHGMVRTEVRSKKVNSHLGHLFDDGPLPSKNRFCINSASLEFIPLEQMKEKGYGAQLFLFAEKKNWEVATFAGGCFWGMEELLRTYTGVIETQVGYTGGEGTLPTGEVNYSLVKQGKSGHAETVQILFDPKKVSYEELVVRFFKMHDPTTPNRQGNDVGTQYRSAVFYKTEEQLKVAKKIRDRAQASGKFNGKIVTEFLPLQKFFRAEPEHQKYLVKNPNGYTCHYLRKIEF